MQLANEALKLSEQSNNDKFKAMAFASVSAAYQLQDNVELAFEFAIKALAISEKITLSNKIMSIIYRRLGFVNTRQLKNDEAIAAFKKAYEFSARESNYRDMAGIAGTIGLLYKIMKNYPMALSYQQQAIELAQKHNEPDIVVRNLINLLHIYDDLKNDLKVYATIKEIDIWIDKKGVSPIVKCLACTVVAENDLRYGSGSEYFYATKYLDKMGELLKITSPGNDNLIDYYLNKALLDFSKQRYKDASIAFSKYNELRSKVDEEIIKGHSQELAVKYETGKKEEQIKNLNATTELQMREQALGQKQRNWALVLAGLLAVMVYLFYNRFRLKKKTSDALAIKNAEIEKQKEVIQTSLGEKETLLREIHHRVKNNLQIISSLLNIQSAHIQDEQVLSSIQEGQSRVQAMSLIHQNLYQSEHLSNVDIQNYLQQLVAYLSEMFAGQSKNIQVTVDAPEINFDIDTAIPLGLIINELVSNAYKYAFDKDASGNINISIKPKSGSDYELEIRDDGKGLPADAEKGNSLGLKLVKILSRQLRGTFSFKSDNGAVFLIQFKDLRAYQTSQS